MYNVIIRHKPVFHVYFYNIRFSKGDKPEKSQGKGAIFRDISEHRNSWKGWILSSWGQIQN